MFMTQGQLKETCSQLCGHLGLQRGLARFDLLLPALVLLEDPLRIRHYLIRRERKPRCS